MPEEKKSISIVIVEDHQTTLEGLERQLAEESNFAVLGVAVDAEEGLNMARQLRPDAIVLDLHLPKTKGPKSMVQDFSSTGSKVIVLSGENRAALVSAVMEAGASAYVIKSEKLSTVCLAIRLAHDGKEAQVFGKLSHVPPSRLSVAEQEILKLLARGLKYEEIATARITSAATAKKQCERLRVKLNLSNREQLIAWAITNGFANLEVD